MVTAYPEGDVGPALDAPAGAEGNSKDHIVNSSEEDSDSKSASSSSEEKKDGNGIAKHGTV